MKKLTQKDCLVYNTPTQLNIRMDTFIKNMMTSVNEYLAKNYARAPECWVYPDDMDREEFRSTLYGLEEANNWWSELLHKGSPVHLDAIYTVLTNTNHQLKNTVLLSLIEVLWALDNSGEPVNRGMIAWFRNHKFKSPQFSWEAGGSPPTTPSSKTVIVIEKPITLADYIKLEEEERNLREALRTHMDESSTHITHHRLAEVHQILTAARAQVVAVPSRTGTR